MAGSLAVAAILPEAALYHRPQTLGTPPCRRGLEMVTCTSLLLFEHFHGGSEGSGSHPGLVEGWPQCLLG